MIIRFAVVLSCLAIAACAVRPPPDTASVPFAAFGTMDNDVAAANQAAWAFAAAGFTLPPEATLRALGNLPYIRSANLASSDAVSQMLPGGDGRHHSRA